MLDCEKHSSDGILYLMGRKLSDDELREAGVLLIVGIVTTSMAMDS